jgi:transposase InsO family protein
VVGVLEQLAFVLLPRNAAPVLLPVFAKAGWPIHRVLTDGGGEFKGTFDEICIVRGIRHTRTKPRHAWTNGLVERLQQTILHEHWRVAFRAYFTDRAALHRTLQRFMRFDNCERPHHCYRVRGRTPASLVFGAQAVAR